MAEVKSIWHEASDLDITEVGAIAEGLASREPEGSTSRFLTVIGSSNEYNLNLLTAFTEQRRFESKFNNSPDEMASLYGKLGEDICILVLDKDAPQGALPACVCRIAVGEAQDPLPTNEVLKISDKEQGYSKSKSIWRVSKDEYREGLHKVEDPSGKLFDVATLANLEEYRNGIASLQIFSAFARMYEKRYKGFKGKFVATIVTDVADIVNLTTGYNVLEIFPGTKPENFYGAERTAPHTGVIHPEMFSDDMRRRMSTADNEVDTQNSTYLFL